MSETGGRRRVRYQKLTGPQRVALTTAGVVLAACAAWYVLGERHIFAVVPACVELPGDCRVSVGVAPDPLTSVTLIILAAYALLMGLSNYFWVIGPNGAAPAVDREEPETMPLTGGEQPPSDKSSRSFTADEPPGAPEVEVNGSETRKKLLAKLKSNAVAQLAKEWSGIAPDRSLLDSIREVRIVEGRKGSHPMYVRLRNGPGSDYWYRITNGGRGKTTSTIRGASGEDADSLDSATSFD